MRAIVTRKEKIKWFFSWLNNARSEKDLETKLNHIQQYFKIQEQEDVPERMMDVYRLRLNKITQQP